MRDDSAENLFQSFLRDALVSSSSMGRDVDSLMLSIQHFLCRPRRRPPSKVPWRMVLERLSWRVTCPNLASVRPLNYNHWTEAFISSAVRENCLDTLICSQLRLQLGQRTGCLHFPYWDRGDLSCLCCHSTHVCKDILLTPVSSVSISLLNFPCCHHIL